MLVTSVRNINGCTIALNIQFISFYEMRYNFKVTSKKDFKNRKITLINWYRIMSYSKQNPILFFHINLSWIIRAEPEGAFSVFYWVNTSYIQGSSTAASKAH